MKVYQKTWIPDPVLRAKNPDRHKDEDYIMRGPIMVAKSDYDVLKAENSRLNAWIADLQSGMYVNCVYCGHRYGPGETTPVSMADALKAHVEQCQKHPMSALRAALRELIPLARHAEYPEGDDPAVARAKRLVG